MTYLTNCTESDAHSIHQLLDDAVEITYKTFCKYVSQVELQSVFSQYSFGNQRRGLHLKNDLAVRYYKSTYRGKKCVFIDHSAIDYIFANS